MCFSHCSKALIVVVVVVGVRAVCAAFVVQRDEMMSILQEGGCGRQFDLR